MHTNNNIIRYSVGVALLLLFGCLITALFIRSMHKYNPYFGWNEIESNIDDGKYGLAAKQIVGFYVFSLESNIRFKLADPHLIRMYEYQDAGNLNHALQECFSAHQYIDGWIPPDHENSWRDQCLVIQCQLNCTEECLPAYTGTVYSYCTLDFEND